MEGIDKVYVVVEPDQGGHTLKEKLPASGIRDRLHFVDLGEFKDASGLYLAEREHFKERFTAALRAATPYADFERAEREATARQAWAECEDLVLSTEYPTEVRRGPRSLRGSG